MRQVLFAGWLILVVGLVSCVHMVSGKDLAAEYYNLANGYLVLKRYAEAIQFYERSLQLDPEQAKSTYNLALAYLESGKAARACELIEGLLQKDSNNTGLMAFLAYARYLEGKDDEAISLYKKILEVQSEDRTALYNLALVYWKKKDLISARLWLDRLLKRNPSDAEALFAYGSLLSEEAKQSEAVEYFKQYLQLKPQAEAGYLALARAYIGLEQYLKALDVLEKVLVLNPKLTEAWFLQAQILLTKAEDPDRGYTSLEQAVELGFNDKNALAQLVEKVNASRFLDYEKNRIAVFLKKKNLLP